MANAKTLTERMDVIRTEHAAGLESALLMHLPTREIDRMEINRLSKFWIKSAVAATELACNADTRERESAAAQTRQQAVKSLWNKGK